MYEVDIFPYGDFAVLTIPDVPTRNELAEKYQELLDNATADGYAMFETSGDVEVAKCTLSDPCAGSASAGVITFNAISSDTDADGGTIDHVSFYAGDATKICEATIATDSTQELQIGNLTITVGSTVGISSLTLTVPASS